MSKVRDSLREKQLVQELSSYPLANEQVIILRVVITSIRVRKKERNVHPNRMLENEKNILIDQKNSYEGEVIE